MRNIGWLYYRDYFATLAADTLKTYDYGPKNKGLYREKLPEGEELARLVNVMRSPLASTWFSLSTIYPGLLAGTGLPHGIKNETVLRLGFSFDHTTGLPVIPGSSVKGRLRSFFPNRLRMKALQSKKVGERLMKESKPDAQAKGKKSLEEGERLLRKAAQMEKYLLHLLAAEAGVAGMNAESLLRLEWALFDGMALDGVAFRGDVPDFANLKEKPLPGPRTTLFFDAFPVGIDKEKNKGNQLLGEDTITPHRHQKREFRAWDALSNPVPIQFLKVLPGVHWEFGFRLPDLELTDQTTVTATQLKKLFTHLLTQHGAGAKTAVGYGQFERVDFSDEEKAQQAAERLENEARWRAQLDAEIQQENSRRNAEADEIHEANRPKADEIRQKYLTPAEKYLQREDGWYFTGKLKSLVAVEAFCVRANPANPKQLLFRLLLAAPNKPTEVLLKYSPDTIGKPCVVKLMSVTKNGQVQSIEFVQELI